ncbi:MAG: tetratricopeptide repeat protein [Lachnospiraceae bacterium]|nr:tetratricopeptide repeat protein [Lachnospiraceae bacterium]
MLINKKAKIQYKKKKILEYLKSRNGRIVIIAAVAAVILFAGIHIWNRDSLAREGLELCRKGEYAEAQAWFKNAIIADNMNPEYYNYLGLAYLGSQEYEDAAKQFQLALNLDEESQPAYRGLGIAAYKTGDYEASIGYLNQALDYSGIRISDMEYDILWYRADAQKALENYEGAAETYGILLELEGDTALCRYYRGSMYCFLDKKEAAMADFDAAVKMKGNGYELFWNIYDSMAQAGWTKEAEEYLKLTKMPGYVDSEKNGSAEEIRRYQGMIEFVCKDYKRAIELLSLNTMKNDEKAQVYLALAYEMNKDSDKALQIYLEQVNAENAGAADYNRIARYLMRNSQGEQAVKYLKKGIKLFNQSDLKDLYYNMVSAYESYGAYEEALNSLIKYTSLYGEDEAAAHEKAFLKERIQ